jgi:hypothetical protein
MKSKKGKMGLLIAVGMKPNKMAKEGMREMEKTHKHKPEKMEKEKTEKHKPVKKDSPKGKFKRAVENEMKEFKEGKLHSGQRRQTSLRF